MYATLCEYISLQRDGTSTLVRAGLDRFAVPPGFPRTIGAMAYVEIRPGELQEGPHEMTLEVVPEGVPGPPSPITQVRGGLHVLKSLGAKIALPFVASVNTEGKYRVRIKIGNLSDEIAISVETGKAQGEPKK